MNILILPSWYTTPENPISGVFFKEQALALQSYFDRFYHGNKVYVLAVEQFSVLSIRTYLKRKSFFVRDEDGITTVRDKFLCFPKLHKLNFHRGGRKIACVIKRIRRELNLSFDLVHIHSALNAGIWYSLSGLRIPYVITEHSSSYSRNLVTEAQKAYLSGVFDNAAHVIAVGNGLASALKEYTDKPVSVIFNIVTPLFSKKEELITKNKVFTFFSLGVNARTKGFDILLSAFSDYIIQGNMGRLIIAGLTEDEKNWLRSLGIPSEAMQYVELLGMLGRNQVLKEMRLCDCFVLVSRHETFGVVFAEAMYCGKPIIASCTGGPDSFVNDGNGILVPVENTEKTSEALAYMRSNYAKYDAEKIRRYAEDSFSPDVICARLSEIYDGILKQQPSNEGGGNYNKLNRIPPLRMHHSPTWRSVCIA